MIYPGAGIRSYRAVYTRKYQEITFVSTPEKISLAATSVGLVVSYWLYIGTKLID